VSSRGQPRESHLQASWSPRVCQNGAALIVTEWSVNSQIRPLTGGRSSVLSKHFSQFAFGLSSLGDPAHSLALLASLTSIFPLRFKTLILMSSNAILF
jgi:hypothetical protein